MANLDFFVLKFLLLENSPSISPDSELLLLTIIYFFVFVLQYLLLVWVSFNLIVKCYFHKNKVMLYHLHDFQHIVGTNANVSIEDDIEY